jgi:2-amino-4-hydroxy-6-hydroxymethyldihydropteridine diphosphokinase
MVTCYIGIGSNLGDRQYYINTAIKKIMMLIGTRVRKISRIIETLPQGGLIQGPYLNGVIEIETGLNPYQLLQELQKIESSLGRLRSVKNAARTIDLDILTYADLCIEEDALCIPHPRILEREFVLEPLKEISSQEVIKNIQDVFKKKTGKKKIKVKTKRRAPDHRSTRAQERLKRQKRRTRRKS